MRGNHQLEIDSLCSFAGALFPDRIATLKYMYIQICLINNGLFQRF